MDIRSTNQIQKFKTPECIIIDSECVFEFENFRNYKVGDTITSAKVDVFECDVQWWINVSPYNPYNNNNVQFELKMFVKAENVWKTKQYQFRVIGTSKSNEIFGSDFKNIGQSEITAAFPGNCNRHVLLNSLDSTESFILHVKVEIKFLGDSIFLQKKCCLPDAKLEVLKLYSNMLNDSTFSDFTFIVKDKTFKVHKAILASASEIMRKMIMTNLKEAIQGQCIVDDLEPDIFEHMLHFIYAGEIAENLGDVSMELYKAAHYYGITKLMEICKEDIHFRLSADNALETCELATVYDIEDLKIDAWRIAKSQILKIFFPLNVEPLSLNDIREIINIKEKEKEFWLKHKKVNC